jgi:zinc transporter ZupT
VEVNASLVFLAAMTTAAVTGLGALPFAFVKDVSRWWLGIANAVAAGLMLGASHNLITEGTKKSCGDCSPQDSAKIN